MEDIKRLAPPGWTIERIYPPAPGTWYEYYHEDYGPESNLAGVAGSYEQALEEIEAIIEEMGDG